MSFIGIIKNWRDKNKSPKNHGKYITIYPNVKGIHVKLKCTPNIILKNAKFQIRYSAEKLLICPSNVSTQHY